MRQTKSAFQLSPPSPASASTGFFGWTRWYKGIQDGEKALQLEVGRVDAEPEADEAVSDEVTNLFKEAFRKRKQLLGQADDEDETVLLEDYSWPDYVAAGVTGKTPSAEHSNRTSVSSTLPSIDLDDFSSDFDDFSPPRSRHTSPPSALVSVSAARLRATQSNVTLKAPQLLRRVSSSSSILVVPVELPPQSPHSPRASPTFSQQDDFSLSPTLLSSTTSSLSSESTSRSSSTITSTATSISSSLSSTTTTSTRSDSSSIRSRFSSLRKAASSAALKLFNQADGGPRTCDSVAVVPPPLPTTASLLLRDVLLKHDQSTPDSSSPPLASHGFYPYNSSPSDSGDAYDDLESPSSAFPPFDPFATFDDPNASSSPSTFPPSPSSPSPRQQPRLLARQRSFIDPHTRSLRTAPSLLCTPPTPDKNGGAGGGVEREDGSSEGDSSDGPQHRVRSRRKRGKRKSKSARSLDNRSSA